MVVIFKATCNEPSTTISCVSAVPNTGRGFSEKASDGFLYAVAIKHDQFSLTDLRQNGQTLDSCVVKFHTVNEKSFLSCIGGQSYIIHSETYPRKIDNIATMDTPTVICSDDIGHIYVSGQGSNDIHRLEGYIQESLMEPETVWKVFDISLDTQHGINMIKDPVALCFNMFNEDYSKLYIVNEWGKSVLVFDVI
ncbi:unnamed protein product [Mytilus coruscus]|uniref:Uncharacterized protein n=1 Tax=Mytilus coruscus TaxID=42192 RepID=A0A6J8EFZ9_MYTCO|nr:unnamed protein product [Mytilus coruscus]